MADVFSASKRSEVMSRIRSRGNRDTELRMLALLKKYKLKGWRRGVNLIGKPDFVWKWKRLALFVDGCFWHCCPKHGHTPRSRKAYWVAKLSRNMRRDREVSRGLRKSGWKVLRVWECFLTGSRTVKTVNRISRALKAASGKKECREAATATE